MRTTPVAESLTVFALFFGLALLDAVQRRTWWTAAGWLAVGVAFVVLARRGRGVGPSR